MADIRNLEINIFEDVDFEILDANAYKNRNDGEPLGIFGVSAKKDGLIIYIFDICLLDLDLAKKDKKFYEICNFTHFEANTKEKIHEFQGTFIDALEYIKERFYKII